MQRAVQPPVPKGYTMLRRYVNIRTTRQIRLHQVRALRSGDVPPNGWHDSERHAGRRLVPQRTAVGAGLFSCRHWLGRFRGRSRPVPPGDWPAVTASRKTSPSEAHLGILSGGLPTAVSYVAPSWTCPKRKRRSTSSRRTLCFSITARTGRPPKVLC